MEDKYLKKTRGTDIVLEKATTIRGTRVGVEKIVESRMKIE